MKWYEKLKFARKILRYSLRDVKGRTGISDAYLCEIENGRVNDPSYFKIQKLLTLYNLDHRDLVGEK